MVTGKEKVWKIYLSISLIVLGCNNTKTEAGIKEENTVRWSLGKDTIQSEKQLESRDFETLKEKLIGRVYRKTYDIPEFNNENYSSGGFSIGSSYQEGYIFNEKEFSKKKIYGKKGALLFLIFNELDERDNDGKAYFKIIDMLEIEKETDAFRKYPEKNLTVMSNVAVNGKIDTELLALAVREFDEYGEDKEVLTEIYKLWRANRKTGKFEEIKDLTGVSVITNPH